MLEKKKPSVFRSAQLILPSLFLAAVIGFNLLFATPAAAGGKLYLTSRGTYWQPENTQNLHFLRNKYLFSADGGWYHMERLAWDFVVRGTKDDNTIEERFDAASQDLMVKKLTISDKKSSRYARERLYVLHTNRPGIDSWLNDSTYATTLLMEKTPGHQLFTKSTVYPAYIGDRVVSVLEVFNLYAGGAHGMSGYECQTYNLSGQKLTIKDLFDDWSAAKPSLIGSFQSNWDSTAEKTARKKSESEAEFREARKIIRNMKSDYKAALQKDLGDQGFIFTRSAGGIRLNLFYPPHSFGAHAYGGTWISLPVKNLAPAIKTALGRWVEADDSHPPALPEKLGFFEQRTRHYGVFPDTGSGVKEFVIGYEALAAKSKRPALINEMLNDRRPEKHQP